jgi:BirA family biotin operon repressor/biotin-[acetyl-CoA-carboxylase] ligase
MSTTAELRDATTDAAPSPTVCGDWILYQYPVVTSTNLLAKNLPAWTAIRAETQTGGRGRFQRTWISDRGGLWLSAVVPAKADQAAQRALPLAAGLAVNNALSELGIQGIRLRWPNDVLIHDRKLAGLLIDQFQPGLAVVGIGLNVTNQPEAWDPGLLNRTTRLADLIPTTPGLRRLTEMLLHHLRQVLTELQRNGATSLFLRVNKLWDASRPVELDLDGMLCRGLFTGVDEEGRLRLSDGAGNLAFFDAHQVRHLTEI